MGLRPVAVHCGLSQLASKPLSLDSTVTSNLTPNKAYDLKSVWSTVRIILGFLGALYPPPAPPLEGSHALETEAAGLPREYGVRRLVRLGSPSGIPPYNSERPMIRRRRGQLCQQ